MPAALSRRRDVTTALVRAEIRDTRDLTPLGVVKWLLEPFMFMCTYFVLVDLVFRRGQRAYPLFLLCALLPWSYLQSVTSRGMLLIPTYGSVISTRILPRRTLPLVLVASEGINFMIALVLLVPFMIYYRVGGSLALLWLPVLIAVLAVLVSGPAFMATVFGLYFPDYRGAAQNVIRLGFLASTGLIAARNIPGDNLPALMQVNPLSGIFDSFRDVLIAGRAPRLWHLAYPLLVGLVLLAVGVALYGWREFEFSKEV
jgi:homopolymeric O-antigen transport system permease protein